MTDDAVDCLRRACCNGRSFNEDTARGLLNALFNADPHSVTVTAADLRDEATKLATVLGKASELLEKAMKSRRKLYFALIQAHFLNGAGNEPEPPFDLTSTKLRADIGALLRLKKAAERVIKANARTPGNRVGSGVLPRERVCSLAYIYKRCTGREPTTTQGGPFDKFVGAVCGEYNLKAKAAKAAKADTILRAVKDGLKDWRKVRGERPAKPKAAKPKAAEPEPAEPEPPSQPLTFEDALRELADRREGRGEPR